ncbi:uncharacterized protein LOC122312704 [Carya illinoinensis]|uniref:uncharacterized protein LOC122312704 n=1 Tax=Carya illinoinensis TaxID=32201 RepID=UPI001C71C048|nr:uncharacterized protein LOC122312704 [Carya illinoinensis]
MGLEENARVSCLIDRNSSTWNTTLVRAVFEEEEANLICRTPLSMTNVPDKMVWRCTRNGEFSVRSAYHLMNEMVDMVRGQTSATTQNWTLWASIWKIRAPNAYKMLLWRASLESLPTTLNLFKRKVVDAPYCPVCLTEEETVNHALWSCRSAQVIWGSSSRKLQKFQTVETPFPELLFLMFNALDEETMQEVAATIYQIWRRRNKMIFEHKFASPTEVVMLAQQAVIDFQEANRGRSGEPTRQT